MPIPFRNLLLASSLAVLAAPTLQAQPLSYAPAAAFVFQSEAQPQAESAAAEPKAGHGEVEEEENAQFKYSKLVQSTAAKTGLSKEAVYWLFTCINFAFLAAALYWMVKKALPNGFTPRTAEIQKGIEEARKASAEATAKLAEIEARLSKLDAEIAEIEKTAEADFSAEEQRIKAAAEQDAANVVASAEQEIAAAARNAQRELKAYAAELAVNLAEKKIKVDDATDKALIAGFANQLGKDAR